MPNNTHICAATADLERRLAASQSELSAARAQVASLQRQLELKVEAASFAVVVTPPDRFDEPTRRRGSTRPAIIRREAVTAVIPCVEVRL